jgi:hypothetical protein
VKLSQDQGGEEDYEDYDGNRHDLLAEGHGRIALFRRPDQIKHPLDKPAKGIHFNPSAYNRIASKLPAARTFATTA